MLKIKCGVVTLGMIALVFTVACAVPSSPVPLALSSDWVEGFDESANMQASANGIQMQV